MAYELQEINRRIRSDVKGFLEECDREYGLKVAVPPTASSRISGKAQWCFCPAPPAQVRPLPRRRWRRN